MAITDKLSDIADGVRYVTGGSSTMTMAQMATNLTAMQKTDSMQFTPVYTPPTWASGSWEDIAIALARHYDANDSFDIHDYWNIGDTRTVHLNAMDAVGVGESHVAQDVELVLMAADHYDMSDNSGKAAFVWGLKNCLSNGTAVEGGNMENTNTNQNGWHGCLRRTWCQDIFKTALPNMLQSMLKQVNIVTSTKGNASGITTSADYIFLPAEKEVFGINTSANENDESTLLQYEWYETSDNRIKKAGSEGSMTTWRERSPISTGTATFCCVTNGTSASVDAGAVWGGIAPHGCI